MSINFAQKALPQSEGELKLDANKVGSSRINTNPVRWRGIQK